MTTQDALPASLYPSLAQVLPTLAELGPGGTPMQVPAGTVLFSENAPCQGFPLVLEGEIKVSRASGDGRTLELYRVVPGEAGFSVVCESRPQLDYLMASIESMQ